jgi:hypothetical protein
LVGHLDIVDQLVFEPGSHVLAISAITFSLFRSLKFLILPASLFVISENCFSGLKLLRRLMFEEGSELVGLKWRAFFKCGRCSDDIREEIDAFLEPEDPLDFCFALRRWTSERLQNTRNEMIKTDVLSEGIWIPASVKVINKECFAYRTIFRLVYDH